MNPGGVLRLAVQGFCGVPMVPQPLWDGDAV